MAVIATGLLAGAAGVSYAASVLTSSGAATSIIQACQNRVNGDLRVVADNSTECRTNEMAISWNEGGVAGAAGPTGPTGPQGATGATGAAGTNGTNGTNGATGAKGDPCLSSDPACVGPKGAQGDPGTNGTNGADGAACLATNPACVGPAGADGAKGDPCLSSDPACVGPKGDKGDPGTNGTGGATGPQGPPGSSLTGTRTVTILPPQPAGELRAYGAVSRSLDFGTLSATCRADNGLSVRSEMSLYITDTTAGDSRLWLAESPYAAARSLPADLRVELQTNVILPFPEYFASEFTVMRFTTNPESGSPYFSSEHIAAGFEVLADGSCRVSTSITNDQ